MKKTGTKVVTAHIPVKPTKKVEQEEKHRQSTLTALADVDSGRVIDHQTVQAWADRLNAAHRRTTR